MAIYPLSRVNMALDGLGCPCTGLCCQGYMADQCLYWSKQWLRLCSHFWSHFKLSSWDWNVTSLSGLCSWAWNEVMWPPCVASVSHVMAECRELQMSHMGVQIRNNCECKSRDLRASRKWASHIEKVGIMHRESEHHVSRKWALCVRVWIRDKQRVRLEYWWYSASKK